MIHRVGEIFNEADLKAQRTTAKIESGYEYVITVTFDERDVPALEAAINHGYPHPEEVDQWTLDTWVHNIVSTGAGALLSAHEASQQPPPEPDWTPPVTEVS